MPFRTSNSAETSNNELMVEILEREEIEAKQQVLFEIIQGTGATSNLDELLRLIHRAIGRVLYAENLLLQRVFVDESQHDPMPQAI